MLIYTRHDPRFHDRRLYKGGGGSTTTTEGARTTTTNIDERMAVQDGVGVNGDGNNTNYSIVSNSSDAVVAMANMGADIIKSSGGAVVDLYKNAGEQNSDAWNATITQGAKLIDKLIDKAADENSLASKVVDSFMPNENKNAENLKYAAIAAAVIGAAAFWSKQK
ncbi:hypothetical protein [Polaromonas sp. YR568]|uniref:hypothetical protein n=1 Tax=Polaromonas sp. YR568 TaxID=1855301 RepID=UPI003137DFD3